MGSNLAVGLKKKYPAYRIICFDNLSRRGSELNLPRFSEFGIEFIHGDIRNKEDFHSIGEIDTMIEASAEPSVLAGLDSKTDFIIQNNFIGSVHCFDFALQHKAAVIFLSTSRVYPIPLLESLAFTEKETRFEWEKQKISGASEKGIAENFPLDGYRSMYGATKLASELVISEYVHYFGLRAVINRCGVIAGPWQMGKTDQGVVALWLARHLWKKPVSYIGYGGKGKQVRDVLHISDLLRLVDFEITNPAKVNGRTYNVGGGKDISVSLTELTMLCEEATGNSITIGSVPETRAADVRIYITDHTKVTQETGWKPELGAADIVRDTFNWMVDKQGVLENILNQ